MSILRKLTSFAITATLIKFAMATTYTVGGPNGGWDFTTNLQTWASSQTFKVGDSVLFQYLSGLHDVLEVSKADYDSCTASSPIKSYTSGSDTIPLSSPGKRYFICGKIGHCVQGMKVQIDTSASTTTPPSPPPSSSSPPPSSPSPPPVSAPSATTPTPSPPVSIPSPKTSPSPPPSSSASPSPSGSRSATSPSALPTTNSTWQSAHPPSSASRSQSHAMIVSGSVMMVLLAL